MPELHLGTADGGERFLVTGSEGCIGSWVVRNLLLAGYDVVAADIAADGRRLAKILAPEHKGRLVQVNVDITTEQALADLVTDHKITRLVHLAALQVPFVAADPVRGGLVNVIGTLRVLEAVRHSGGSISGMVYASSAAAIGPEDRVYSPDTLYGVFKQCNEKCAEIYARDYATPSVGLRPCIVYGPGRDQGLTAALTHAVKAALLGVPYEIPFCGAVDVQFADDVAAVFVSCALLDDVFGTELYDLHGALIEVEDFVDTLAKIEPAAAELITVRAEAVPGGVKFDDADLRARVGTVPNTSIEAGLRRTIEVFRTQLVTGQLSVDELPAVAR